MSKSLTITVIGKRRMTIAERKLVAASAGNKPTYIIWPQAVPVFTKGAAAKKLRNRYRWDAVGKCEDVLDTALAAQAAGREIIVLIGEGVILTGDATAGIYANTDAAWILRDLCNEVADDVVIAAGAEDPREFEGWEPAI